MSRRRVDPYEECGDPSCGGCYEAPETRPTHFSEPRWDTPRTFGDPPVRPSSVQVTGSYFSPSARPSLRGHDVELPPAVTGMGSVVAPPVRGDEEIPPEPETYPGERAWERWARAHPKSVHAIAVGIVAVLGALFIYEAGR